ncbi:MAG TPA: hypothetical protein VN026_00455 [Bacteroidia bacterium]|nr:hypothetical protein [Bacteroidia bacterium]
MRKIIFLILIFGAFINLKSQQDNAKNWSKEDTKAFDTAKDLYNKGLFNSAYDKYVSLRPTHSDDLYLKYLTGVCAIYITDKQTEAETLLNEVKEKDKKNKNIDYYLVLLYHKTYRFNKALDLANALLSNPKLSLQDRSSLERIAFYCKNGNNEILSPVNASIVNLGSLLNTEYAEYSPVVTPEEESIIFTYRGKESMGGLVDSKNKPDPNGDYNEDIFISKKANGVWQKAAPLSELNTIGNDAAIALSPDGKQLFVFKTDGINGDIYVSNRENGKYSAPEKLSNEINSPSWEGSLSMSTDQKKIFFASNRPGGFGGKDLYVATRKPDGTWGNVKNLGNKINTKYDEDAPFIAPDSRTLVFSSEGHNSIGDFDLFTTDWNEADSSWLEPKNLGYPINTTDDDLFYFLSPDGRHGYFSSARTGGNGDQDIYMVDPAFNAKKSYVTIIKGKVTENGLPYETEISVAVEGESKSYSVYKSNSESGNYVISLPTGKGYKLSFYHQILGDRIYNISTKDVDDYAEKVIDVNFGDASAEQNIVIGKSDTAKTAPTSIVTNTAIVTEADVIKKYGSEKVEGLIYFVQVAATKYPEKYNHNTLSKLCKVKDGGTIEQDIKLLVVDKEFDTINSANDFLMKVRAEGQTDAFLTARYKETRYYLQDLMKLNLWSAK